MADREWTDLELYVLQEHIEDFQDGIISRRELLRRVTYMTGSLAATMALLPALGCNVDQPRGGAPSTATAAPSPAALATAAATPYATPPAARSADGVTVRPDDPRIALVQVDVKGPDGASLGGYLARPKAEGRYPGVLVVQENRGVTPHIQDVVRRAATAGFAAITIDLLARDGGVDKVDPSQYSAKLSARQPDALGADLRAALDTLRAQSFVRADSLGAVGFCFGGGLVWNLVTAGAPLKAAAPFYGPAPQNAPALAATKIAVHAVYAELDTRITGSKDALEAELKKSGTPYQITVYPGVNHAFHNDTGERYNADQSQKAWISTVEWFRKHLA
ncbi:MAG TPA: dienelactone hydrolase family protein [Candidatus Limnocylindria bacterium]|nr:dienelactone hydrolase family protein [Candidatus Limnocylindria bacterium]